MTCPIFVKFEPQLLKSENTRSLSCPLLSIAHGKLKVLICHSKFVLLLCWRKVMYVYASHLAMLWILLISYRHSSWIEQRSGSEPRKQYHKRNLRDWRHPGQQSTTPWAMNKLNASFRRSCKYWEHLRNTRSQTGKSMCLLWNMRTAQPSRTLLVIPLVPNVWNASTSRQQIDYDRQQRDRLNLTYHAQQGKVQQSTRPPMAGEWDIQLFKRATGFSEECWVVW